VAKDIEIRNVPDDVYEVYERRAAAAGQSLEEYLLSDLSERARRLTMHEWLDQIASMDRAGSTVTGEEIVDHLREDRDSH
jgi:antitoxin FitA